MASGLRPMVSASWLLGMPKPMPRRAKEILPLALKNFCTRPPPLNFTATAGVFPEAILVFGAVTPGLGLPLLRDAPPDRSFLETGISHSDCHVSMTFDLGGG